MIPTSKLIENAELKNISLEQIGKILPVPNPLVDPTPDTRSKKERITPTQKPTPYSFFWKILNILGKKKNRFAHGKKSGFGAKRTKRYKFGPSRKGAKKYGESFRNC